MVAPADVSLTSSGAPALSECMARASPLALSKTDIAEALPPSRHGCLRWDMLLRLRFEPCVFLPPLCGIQRGAAPPDAPPWIMLCHTLCEPRKSTHCIATSTLGTSLGMRQWWTGSTFATAAGSTLLFYRVAGAGAVQAELEQEVVEHIANLLCQVVIRCQRWGSHLVALDMGGALLEEDCRWY